jgi:CRP/FNR family transcriptional regulator, cyclic AMP receptor protein
MSTTSQSPEDLLSGVDLFSGISRRHLRKMISRSREVDHPADREIAAQGLGGMAFHLILEGEVSVSQAGREVRRLLPGEYFGEISMIDGRPRTATVTTIRPTRTLAVPHQVFEELTIEEPEFARGLLKTLCTRLRDVEAKAARTSS